MEVVGRFDKLRKTLQTFDAGAFGALVWWCRDLVRGGITAFLTHIYLAEGGDVHVAKGGVHEAKGGVNVTEPNDISS